MTQTNEPTLFHYAPAQPENRPEPDPPPPPPEPPPNLTDTPADVALSFVRAPKTMDALLRPYLRLTTSDVWSVADSQAQNLLVQELLTRLVQAACGKAVSRSLGKLGNVLVRWSKSDLRTPAKLLVLPQGKGPTTGKKPPAPSDPQGRAKFVRDNLDAHCVVVVEGRGIAVLQVECARQVAHVTANYVMLDLQRALLHRGFDGHSQCFLDFPRSDHKCPSRQEVAARAVSAAFRSGGPI